MSEAKTQNPVNASFARPSAALVRALRADATLCELYFDALALMQDKVLPLVDGPEKPRFSAEEAEQRLKSIGEGLAERAPQLHKHFVKNKAVVDAITAPGAQQASNAAAAFAAAVAETYAQLTE